MKVDFDGKRKEFTPLLQVLQVKNNLLLAVEPLRKRIKVQSTTTAAILFNIIGFYVQLLDDKDQNTFVKEVQDELADMIDNGFDKFERGKKAK